MTFSNELIFSLLFHPCILEKKPIPVSFFKILSSVSLSVFFPFQKREGCIFYRISEIDVVALSSVWPVIDGKVYLFAPFSFLFPTNSPLSLVFHVAFSIT